MTTSPRIALLHATPVAIDPIQRAFEESWPEAERFNLLDESLTIDVARMGLNGELIDRFVALGLYAQDTKADGVLVTCSAFGPAIDRLKEKASIPVLKPNEAMFRSAIASGSDIGMLATFEPSVAPMEDEFTDFAKEIGSGAKLTTVLVDSAINLLRAGDAESHNRLVAEQADKLAHCDTIMLAHYSTSNAATAVRAQVDVPIITAPSSSVLSMKELVAGTAQTDNEHQTCS